MRAGSIPRLTILFALLLVTGCGSSTQLSGVWANPEYRGEGIDHILVIGVADNDLHRRLFEAEVVDRLQDYKIKAISSAAVLPSRPRVTEERAAKINEDKVRQYVADNEVDGIFVTRVFDVSTHTEYVPPRTYVTGYPSYGHPYYGSWYGYYSHSYGVVHEPGYSYDNTTVTLESNLYDTRNDQLVWAAQSQTFNPSHAEDVIIPVSRKIVDSLYQQKVIKPSKRK
jgi:hypothetical protein